MALEPATFQIISSLRYEPALPTVIQHHSGSPDLLNTPYYLLPYHQERLLHAAQSFHWPKAVAFLQQDLTHFIQFLDSFIAEKTKPWRLRIVVDSNGTGTVDVHPTASIDPLNLLLPSDPLSQTTVWTVRVDSETTDPSRFTTHKTTSRELYSAARLRAGITSPQEPAEVLLVNATGEVMEGSITTPYFRRRGSGESPTGPQWVTPPLSCGGNAGTSRRYALAGGFCSEQTIPAANLVDGEECWLSNGVRGFLRGKIVRGR